MDAGAGTLLPDPGRRRDATLLSTASASPRCGLTSENLTPSAVRIVFMFGEFALPAWYESLFLLSVLVLQPGDHRGVREGGRVAQSLALGDVAEQTAHDLAAAGLRQIGSEDQVVRSRQRADLLRDMPLELLHQLLRSRIAILDGDEGRDGLPFDLVGTGDDRGLGDERIVDKSRLDLHGRHAVARNVHDVVHATQQPEVALIVDLGAIAGEVDARIAAPVLRLEALRVAVDAPEHAGPRLLDHEIDGLGQLTLVVEHFGRDPREGFGCRTGLERSQPRQRRDEDVSGLRLPPRVHHGTATAAYHLPIPDPCFGVDRLADAAE